VLIVLWLSRRRAPDDVAPPLAECHDLDLWSPLSEAQEVGRFQAAGWNDLKFFSNPKNFKPTSTIVDVGGNVGLDLVRFAKRAAEDGLTMPAIHAFEPLAAVFATLQSNVKPFRNIVLHNVGLSNKTGESCLVIGGTNEDAAYEVEPYSAKCDPRYRFHTVDVAMELRKLGRVDLLHLNCEGCEARILERLLRSNMVPIRRIEMQVHASHVAPSEYCRIDAALRARGYRLQYRYQWVWELWERPEP
jgi:FkbM family methyltransferase